jgi:hypothetical protein
MSAAAAIITALEANAGVTAIVGTAIYSTTAPDGFGPPCVIMQQIAGSPGVSHTGPSGATERMFQFACLAGTQKAARALRDAVIEALDGVELSNGDNPTLEDERDGDVEDGARIFRADCDFLV